MTFTGHDAPMPVPTIGNWLRNPVSSYHPTDGITFKRYAPVMPTPLPPTPMGGANYGQWHPFKWVNKITSPRGQNVYSLYTNPQSQYVRATFGQR